MKESYESEAAATTNEHQPYVIEWCAGFECQNKGRLYCACQQCFILILARRRHAPSSKCALNSDVRLITRFYGTCSSKRTYIHNASQFRYRQSHLDFYPRETRVGSTCRSDVFFCSMLNSPYPPQWLITTTNLLQESPMIVRYNCFVHVTSRCSLLFFQLCPV